MRVAFWSSVAGSTGSIAATGWRATGAAVVYLRPARRLADPGCGGCAEIPEFVRTFFSTGTGQKGLRRDARARGHEDTKTP